MEQKYLVFCGIILGVIIIGGFVYSGMISEPLPPESNFPKFIAQVAKEKPSTTAAKCEASETIVVTKIIDGDTVIVEGGYHVRLIGIDADEKDYPCYAAAKNRLEELVLGRQVVLEKDITDTDKYERCLRTVFLEGQNIGAQLVGEGLAVARFYAPDGKYKKEILTAEKEAIA